MKIVRWFKKHKFISIILAIGIIVSIVDMLIDSQYSELIGFFVGIAIVVKVIIWIGGLGKAKGKAK